MGSLLEASERVHESLALRGNKDAKGELARLEVARSAANSGEMSRRCLHEHTRDVLGLRPKDRHVYIMVTAPSASEADRAWMLKMFTAGMNVLRINCAHEGEKEWGQLVRALGDARKASGKECRILMDLAGPKIRTGPVGGRRVTKWKPDKDDIGEATAPARVAIRRASARPAPGTGPFLFVRDEAFAKVRTGDECVFVTPATRSACWAFERLGRTSSWDSLPRLPMSRTASAPASTARGCTHVT